MANDNLTGQTIASTYDQLLITADTGGIPGSGTNATQITCGAATAGASNANTTALYLSTNKVGINEAAPDHFLHMTGANAQICIEEDADEFLDAAKQKAKEGKIMHGAMVSTVATELKNFEKVGDELKRKSDEWREKVDPPGAFDDPSSLKYHMLEGKAKLEEVTSKWSGLSIFQRT